ncbi:MAG: cation diffusion facilitator family transporter [Deltaproteobacteria bacterium]
MSTHENHHHDEASWGRRLLASMVMNLIIPAVQIYGGIVSGSMALISDALHNLSDFISLVINYAALIIGKRGPTLKHTFGFKRVEIFATLISVALLYGAAFYIAVEAWQRFRNPQPITGQLVIWIALLGFVGNVLSALLLHAGSKVNLNMKSAFFHMLADAATSLGVLALGVLWMFKPWYWLDPLFSWLIVAMIFYSGWGLVKDSVLILMNATPPGIDPEEIQKALEAIDGIIDIHDLHIWNASSESIALAVHITVPDQMLASVDELAARVRTILSYQFRIDHPTLQFESNRCKGGELLCHLSPNGGQNHKH